MTKNIAESELVLNEDGSVYHLHLLPGDIADTIILVGDQDRVGEVSRHFDRIELKKQRREFVTHTGYVGSKRLSVVSTGIGTDNIDIVLNELDALVNIDLQERVQKKALTTLKLIRVGTSGSLQKDIPVDSILVSSHALGLDALLSFYQLNSTREELSMHSEIIQQLHLSITHSYLVKAPGTMVHAFSDFMSGITATCCGFYAPQGRTLRAKPVVPDLISKLHRINVNGTRITNFEMETAGIYGMARVLGHEAVSVNAILANRITREFSQQPQQVVDSAIRQVLAIVENIA